MAITITSVAGGLLFSGLHGSLNCGVGWSISRDVSVAPPIRPQSRCLDTDGFSEAYADLVAKKPGDPLNQLAWTVYLGEENVRFYVWSPYLGVEDTARPPDADIIVPVCGLELLPDEDLTVPAVTSMSTTPGPGRVVTGWTGVSASSARIPERSGYILEHREILPVHDDNVLVAVVNAPSTVSGGVIFDEANSIGTVDHDDEVSDTQDLSYVKLGTHEKQPELTLRVDTGSLSALLGAPDSPEPLSAAVLLNDGTLRVFESQTLHSVSGNEAVWRIPDEDTYVVTGKDHRTLNGNVSVAFDGVYHDIEVNKNIPWSAIFKDVPPSLDGEEIMQLTLYNAQSSARSFSGPVFTQIGDAHMSFGGEIIPNVAPNRSFDTIYRGITGTIGTKEERNKDRNGRRLTVDGPRVPYAVYTTGVDTFTASYPKDGVTVNPSIRYNVIKEYLFIAQSSSVNPNISVVLERALPANFRLAQPATTGTLYDPDADYYTTRTGRTLNYLYRGTPPDLGADKPYLVRMVRYVYVIRTLPERTPYAYFYRSDVVGDATDSGKFARSEFSEDPVLRFGTGAAGPLEGELEDDMLEEQAVPFTWFLKKTQEIFTHSDADLNPPPSTVPGSFDLVRALDQGRPQIDNGRPPFIAECSLALEVSGLSDSVWTDRLTNLVPGGKVLVMLVPDNSIEVSKPWIRNRVRTTSHTIENLGRGSVWQFRVASANVIRINEFTAPVFDLPTPVEVTGLGRIRTKLGEINENDTTFTFEALDVYPVGATVEWVVTQGSSTIGADGSFMPADITANEETTVGLRVNGLQVDSNTFLVISLDDTLRGTILETHVLLLEGQTATLTAVGLNRNVASQRLGWAIIDGEGSLNRTGGSTTDYTAPVWAGPHADDTATIELSINGQQVDTVTINILSDTQPPAGTIGNKIVSLASDVNRHQFHSVGVNAGPTLISWEIQLGGGGFRVQGAIQDTDTGNIAQYVPDSTITEEQTVRVAMFVRGVEVDTVTFIVVPIITVEETQYAYILGQTAPQLPSTSSNQQNTAEPPDGYSETPLTATRAENVYRIARTIRIRAGQFVIATSNWAFDPAVQPWMMAATAGMISRTLGVADNKMVAHSVGAATMNFSAGDEDKGFTRRNLATAIGRSTPSDPDDAVTVQVFETAVNEALSEYSISNETVNGRNVTWDAPPGTWPWTYQISTRATAGGAWTDQGSQTARSYTAPAGTVQVRIVPRSASDALTTIVTL